MNSVFSMNTKMNFMYVTSFLVLHQISFISASEGDRSPFYQKCVKNCMTDTCNPDGRTFKSKSWEQLSIWSWLLWNCRDECRYTCMWRTVDLFEERGYTVPKFHGKWPFVRMYGVQEPGSVMASVLNLTAHVYMYAELTRRFPVRSAPLLLWRVFSAVCMNAWVWSTVFHTRDNPFTEFMDYACALSMVMALFVAAIVRVFHRKRGLTVALLLLTVLYYLEHVRYLYAGLVDYEYNMAVNIVFGVAGSLIWVSWATVQMLCGRRYAWRVAAFTALSAGTLALELLDFPPRHQLWDAHALWHLTTAPLPLLFYRFVIDDLSHIHASRLSGKQDLKTA